MKFSFSLLLLSLFGTGCSLVTVPVKTAGAIVTTTVKTTGAIVTAPFGGDNDEDEEDEKDARKKKKKNREREREHEEVRQAEAYHTDSSRPAYYYDR